MDAGSMVEVCGVSLPYLGPIASRPYYPCALPGLLSSYLSHLLSLDARPPPFFHPHHHPCGSGVCQLGGGAGGNAESSDLHL